MDYGVIVPCQMYANTLVFETLHEKKNIIKLFIYSYYLLLLLGYGNVYLCFSCIYFFAGRRFEKDEYDDDCNFFCLFYCLKCVQMTQAHM